VSELLSPPSSNLAERLGIADSPLLNPQSFSKETPSVVSAEEVDSFSNRLGRSYQQSEKNIADSIGLFAQEFGLEDLEKWAIRTSIKQDADIAMHGQPQRTASFTTGLDEIEAAYGPDGDVGAALDRGGLLLKDMVADGLGSVGLPVAAGLAAVPVAMAGAPAVVTGAVALVLPLTVGAGIASAPIYEEAKKLDASEEDARRFGLVGGLASGLLDRVGAGIILSNLIKQFGKKAITDELANEVGKSAAKAAVESAGRVTSDIAKGSAKGIVGEGVTEGAQEFLQMSAAGLAADKGIMPYDMEIATKRLIDAAALGSVTGGTLGAGSSFVSGRMKRDLAEKELEEKEKITKLENLVNDDEIAKVESFTGTLREGKRMNTSQKIRGAFRSAISPLRGLFDTGGEQGGRLVNSLDNYYDKLSAAVGKDARQTFQDPETGENIEGLVGVFDSLRRSVKLPFQKAISPKVNKRLSDVLTNKVDVDPDPNIMKAARNIREFLGTTELDPDTGKPLPSIKITRSMVRELLMNPEITQEQSVSFGKINPNTGQFFVDQRVFEAVKGRVSQARSELEERVGQSPQEETLIFETVEKDLKPFIGEVLYKPTATGKYKELVDAGSDMQFISGYLPTMIKTGPLNRRKLIRILQEEGLTKQASASVAENIESNEGMYNPQDIKLNLDDYRTPDKRVSSNTESFEMGRTLQDRVRNRLYDEGLIETDVEGILYRYMLDSNKKIQSQNLKKVIQETVPKLVEENNITAAEVDRVESLFNAIQGKYQPLKDKNLQAIQKWTLTGQYIYTLPLVGLTALSEPLIILSRINPKYALFGSAQAGYNALANGLRKVFPKLPKTEAEKAFQGIVQGLDGTLAERFGDLAGVTVSRKVSNAFFRATLLTTITQISRDMAFQAARLQMRDDLRTIRRYEDSDTPKTKEFTNARKRLTAQGLVKPMDDTLQDWANGLYEGRGAPELIRQAMSKTVDEFIMAPNAVNRPLWMSNPHLAWAAQLKGFLATFGNTVGTRLWRDIAVPLSKGRIPAADMMKYTIALSSIIAVSMAMQALRDQIRYGDDADDSPFSQLDGKEKIIEALLRSNIFGVATVPFDALSAEKYGSNFYESILGPSASQFANIAEAGGSYVLSDDSRKLAKEISNLIPLLRNIPMSRDIKQEFVDAWEERLENFKDRIVN